ncbi:type VII secretion target [Prauserella rugosa]|uniref:Excreted virulence factor EspC (Type VII ESX diderm) n=1 Tax=Prauserella rugosa TaxID=43354 RepID=A0A660CA01_9PSEU|nr:type VII secretion target [Prauserella rugosa]TWH18563.1 excreted virulence factor EspC (type VII ESX diderm) [Prauserella rugosa]
MGFEAKIEAIANASSAAEGVAQGVRAVKPAAALPDGPAGIKGAQAVAKLARVKESWQGKGARTADALDQYAQNLSSAAEKYRSSDDAARMDLDGSTGRSRAF